MIVWNEQIVEEQIAVILIVLMKHLCVELSLVCLLAIAVSFESDVFTAKRARNLRETL